MSKMEPKNEAVCPGKKLTRADLDAIRRKLESPDAPYYWRSLEELAQSPEFLEQLHREFPKGASEWLDPVTRRGFLKLMGASLALAGMTACVKQPLEPIVPYVRQPEEMVPGRPLFYATAMTLGGFGLPALVESNMGRPTKVDGNPNHPASLGGSDAFLQASILDLYDPDRSEAILYRGEIRSRPSFLSALRGMLQTQRDLGGAGLRFLTASTSSPTVVAQMRDILERYPQARWYQWEPVNRDSVYAGAQMAFGQPVETQYMLGAADVILSLDAAFLSSGFPGFHRYTREFAARRRADAGLRPFATGANELLPAQTMNRFYMLESSPTNTGANADHRLGLRASEIEKYARILATRLGINAGGGSPLSEAHNRWIEALVKDLQAHRGRCLVIAGEHATLLVHALAHAMNEALANVGKTVSYTEPVLANPGGQIAGLKELVADMQSGKVDVLVMSGVNPVYDAPADLDFSGALGKVAASFHHNLYADETSAHAKWHINATHYLEEWSDVRAKDGTATIVQPLIAPLYDGKSLHEVLAACADRPDDSSYTVVQRYWQSQYKGADFQVFWRRSVHDGFIEDSTFSPLNVRVKNTNFAVVAETAQSPQAIELIFRPDPSIWDGRYSNNAWLQEMAKPMTKVVWDNPCLMSPRMAGRMKLAQNDVIEIDNQGHKSTAAVWIQPGHPDNAITVFFGYGRERAGRAGTGTGFDAYKLRIAATPWAATGVAVRSTGKTYPLITTQGFQSMEGRAIVREASLAEYAKDPEFAHRHEEAPAPGLTLYPGYDYSGNAWGMSIDQSACVGCNACIIACQSENNVPVVGKHEVSRGRHMHWLRVDTYYQGGLDNPKAVFQPVPCMHCENAPCEVVCPVGATVHSTEGLNDMVYNRCVGTRYCSNNCPYKVRRFNFLLFQDWDTPQYKMMRNPEVSVRSRGVMEKCTYCVQRITRGRIEAEKQGRSVLDNEIKTACQQACPADAIVFGNLNDRNSRVAVLKQNPLNYGLLAELNTRPRTTYLALVRNPNPEISESGEKEF